MEQIRRLGELTERVAPGRFPNYTQAHLLYALILLEENRIGRQNLASELRLGEGVIRTILGRLNDAGLIDTGSRGVQLSEEGIHFLDNVKSVLVWGEFPESDLTVDTVNYLVLLRGASDKIHFGVEQRDQALLHGASGATTLVYNDGVWSMPGIDDLVDNVVSVYLDGLNPDSGDVAIIGTSGDSFTAALGALAAGIELV